jgi:uncharacterized membrane protein YsdA (DUF1294 family)
MTIFMLALSFIFITALGVGYFNQLVSIYMLTFILSINFTAFIVYGWDKYKAAKQGQRISEKTLHILSFLGGWPGAAIAQKAFRHKTLKMPFRLWFWLCVVSNISILYCYYFV